MCSGPKPLNKMAGEAGIEPALTRRRRSFPRGYNRETAELLLDGGVSVEHLL